MVGKLSNQGGLRLHGWKVQMGISQSNLHPIQESIQAIASTHSQRVLSGLQLQPQIRHSIARSSAAQTQDDSSKGASFDLWCQGDLASYSDLGGRRLPLLGQAQIAVGAVAAVGDQTHGADGPSAKATAHDQPGYHRPRLKVTWGVRPSILANLVLRILQILPGLRHLTSTRP